MSPQQNPASHKPAAILRDVIRRIEQDTDISPDYPVLIELKRILLLRIAALEMEESSPESSAQTAAVPPEPPLD